MRWQRTSDEGRQWHDKRAAEPRCSDRDRATLEARVLKTNPGKHNLLDQGNCRPTCEIE